MRIFTTVFIKIRLINVETDHKNTFLIIYYLTHFVTAENHYCQIPNYFNYNRAVQPKTLMIDSSTIDPAASKDVAKLASEAGATYIDAPVSGGEHMKN